MGKREVDKGAKSRTYNLLDIKEAVEIKPSDYSKTINTKEFQFVQKPRDGTANYTARDATGDQVSPKHKKGKGLRSKYELVWAGGNIVSPADAL